MHDAAKLVIMNCDGIIARFDDVCAIQLRLVPIPEWLAVKIASSGLRPWVLGPRLEFARHCLENLNFSDGV
jgi:hypothetical protein